MTNKVYFRSEKAAQYGLAKVAKKKIATKFGEDTVKAVLKHGDKAAYLINTYGKKAAIAEHGDEAVKLIKKYSDNAAKAIANCGNNAIIVISSEKNGKKAGRLVLNFGNSVVIFLQENDHITKAVFALNDDAANSFINTVIKHKEKLLPILKKYDECVNDIVKLTSRRCLYGSL